jgi:hypothetical protein
VRKLLIAIAILVVLLLIGDFVAKGYAETQLRDRAQRAVHGATSATGSISSFPFVGRLLLSGSVQEAKVGVAPVVAGRVTFSSIHVDLHDVHVDRNLLIHNQKVRLTSLGSGTVTAEITDVEISRLAGVPISFAPGRATVRAAGVDVSAPLSAASGTLAIGGATGVPIRIRIPRAPLFPCDASSAQVEQGKVVVSCTIDRVPPELVGVTVNA